MTSLLTEDRAARRADATGEPYDVALAWVKAHPEGPISPRFASFVPRPVVAKAIASYGGAVSHHGHSSPQATAALNRLTSTMERARAFA